MQRTELPKQVRLSPSSLLTRSSGLALNLAHPRGNVTGIAIFAEETNLKRVELMREVAPRAVRLAAVTAISVGGPLNLDSVQETGRKLGFAVEIINVADPAHLPEALSPSVVAGFDAFVFVPDVVLTSHRDEVIKLIGSSNKPAIYSSRNWADSGGLMFFGPDFRVVFRDWATQFVRMLKGEKPSDLPFERPTKFDFAINLRTARAMGIEIPPTLLAANIKPSTLTSRSSTVNGRRFWRRPALVTFRAKSRDQTYGCGAICSLSDMRITKTTAGIGASAIVLPLEFSDVVKRLAIGTA